MNDFKKDLEICTDEPLVSVIIPLYNSEKYIAETLKSVLNQSYKNIEVLVIDDGSKDDGLSVAKNFENAHVKIFSQSNKGASAARNYGLREAKGKYIQFLDADDLLSTNKIESQVTLLEKEESKIALCPIAHFFEGDNLGEIEILKEWYHGSFDNPVKFLIQLYGGGESEGGMITIHSWLTPKKLIDQAGVWNEDLSVDDDGEFFCRVILQSTGLISANDAICYYRKFREQKSLSSQAGYKAIKSSLLALQLKQKHLAGFSNEQGYKKAFARAYKRMAVQVYPEFRDVANICVKNMNDLGGTSHDVTIGGAGIELVKKIFGWKFARFIQFSFRRLIKTF